MNWEDWSDRKDVLEEMRKALDLDDILFTKKWAVCDGGLDYYGTESQSEYCSYVFFDGRCLWHQEKTIPYGKAVTNNESEYEAVRTVMVNLQSYYDYRKDLIGNISIYCDSLLVVNQLNNRWQVKSKRLMIKHARVSKLVKYYKVDVKWIDGKAVKKILGH